MLRIQINSVGFKTSVSILIIIVFLLSPRGICSSCFEGVSCRRSPRRAYESSFFHAGCEYLRFQAGSWISKNFFFPARTTYTDLHPSASCSFKTNTSATDPVWRIGEVCLTLTHDYPTISENYHLNKMTNLQFVVTTLCLPQTCYSMSSHSPTSVKILS